jgi:antitoxin component YwqK of YwqJK toxin-antitoxin module
MGNQHKSYLFFYILLFGFSLNAQDSLLRKSGFTTLFYPSGRISGEGILEKGQPVGYWKTYTENGKIKSEGNRKNALLDSTWKFYSEDGVLKTTIDYRVGKKNGFRRVYDNSGSLVSEEAFVEDIKEGRSTSYFPSGKLKYSILFKAGKESGRGVELQENGVIQMLYDYTNGVLLRQQRVNRLDNQSRKTGLWVDLFVSHTTRIEEQYSEGLLNGYLKEYNERGNLIKLEKYVEGILQINAKELERTKLQKEYYDNGKLKRSGSITSNGTAVGIYVSYDSTGVISEAVLYDNGFMVARGLVDSLGLKQGKWQEFYFTGDLKAEGNYQDNQKTGSWVYYHPNKKTEQTGRYLRGKPIDTWRWYYETGSLLKEENYVNGQEDGFSFELDINGDTLSRGEYIDGEREGSWFFKEGNQKRIGAFKEGKMDGIWKHIYEGGKLSFTGKFKQGEPDEKHLAYYPSGILKWEGKYTAGKRDGDWHSYTPDGQLYLTITYSNGIEIKYDGIKIKPEFEQEDFDNLIQENPYRF